ncbi:hypothetical protein HKD37_18G051275 [Glycine soja]|nr:hypothetical protein GmHk_18G052435 [Glycine max]
MDNIFEVVPTTEEQKMVYDTFMLKDEAKNWWKDTRERMMALETPVIWENFKITFLEKYFPHNVRI